MHSYERFNLLFERGKFKTHLFQYLRLHITGDGDGDSKEVLSWNSVDSGK